MNTSTNLKSLRQKAYLAYHQDGIIDLCIGAAVLSFGIWRLTGIILFGSLSWLVFSIYVGLKRVITIPRFGFVRFSESQRKIQISIAIAALMLLVLAVAGLFFFARPDQLPPEILVFMRKFHEFVMSGVGATAMIIFGSWFGIKRVVAYGFLMLAALWLALQIGWSGGLSLVVIGAAILTAGIVLLVNFLRRYPMQPAESENAV